MRPRARDRSRRALPPAATLRHPSGRRTPIPEIPDRIPQLGLSHEDGVLGHGHRRPETATEPSVARQQLRLLDPACGSTVKDVGRSGKIARPIVIDRACHAAVTLHGDGRSELEAAPGVARRELLLLDPPRRTATEDVHSTCDETSFGVEGSAYDGGVTISCYGRAEEGIAGITCDEHGLLGPPGIRVPKGPNCT